MRILLAEDHVQLADVITHDLVRNGYAVDWRTDGRDVQTQAELDTYDAVILDLGLPGKPGINILKAWREQGLMMPVLILTARASWAERIEGLKAGADDYLTKPFHPEELLLRIQALLRRAHGVVNQPHLVVSGLELNESQQSVNLQGKQIELTGAEFRLLRFFMLHGGKLVTKQQLADHLYDGETERDSNVLEVHVNKLRSKLGKEIIETRRGQGYRYIGVSPN
jgi:DNA-binding response OmpR family regulator